MQRLFKGCLFVLLVLMWVWGGVAIYLAGPGPSWANMLLACSFGVLLPGAFFISRSFARGLLFCCVCFAVLLVWWNSLQPTNDKDWAPDIAQISHGEIVDDILTMHNVRNFQYTTETAFTEYWETKTYDLNKFQGLDLYLSYWASDHIAHIILSWDFGDGNPLAISIETRKDKTQQYSAIKGFFKQFELSYVAATEQDIIKLRTNYRKERVYLYRLKTPKGTARELLEDYLKVMNRLVDEPEFYNALTRNCSTSVHLHVDAIHPDDVTPLDWRLLLSGHFDELVYDYQAIIGDELPFNELKKQSRVDLRMQAYDGDDFSFKVRNVSNSLE